jgi:uncharacterized protein (DUF433 family)
MQVGDDENRWQDRIVCTPETLFGKPRIAGTRIGVEFLFELLASGWSAHTILDEYPSLKPEDLRAVFGFARDCVRSIAFTAVQPRPADEDEV